MNLRNILFTVSVFSASILYSQIKVASILSDNMVLQRNSDVKVWGSANPNEKLTIIGNWDNVKTYVSTDEKGNWLTKIRTTEAGGPFVISISSKKEKVTIKNVLLGDVWLCSGQSNMEMPLEGFDDLPVNASTDAILNAENGNIRFFKVRRASVPSPVDSCMGNWSVLSTENAGKLTAVGYFFAKRLQNKLKIPIGLISSNWGGSRIEAWISKENMTLFPKAFAETDPNIMNRKYQKASYLYNGMIVPLKNYGIKGAIWYQGESNIGNYKDYAALMSSMVENWRKDFSVGNFPFYIVQIAPYSYGDNKGLGLPLLCNQQLKASLSIPNVGIVSTIDVGEEKSIHPAEKEIISKRLANLALSETYGIKGIPYKSPVFKEFVVNDSVAVLSFDNIALGLTSYGKNVDCFEIAGEDKVFYPANMKINKSKITVWSSSVKTPVAVRYGFSNFPQTSGFIYNTAGLPLIQFRTDNWDK